MGATATDEAKPGFLPQGERLEVAQARLLHERARSSAVAVFALVALFTVILVFLAPVAKALTWFAAATFMIGVTLAQPPLQAPGGITSANADSYLRLHTLISGVTGLVWGVGAAWLIDFDDQILIFTTTTMVVTITLGGISPQSAFRRSYVALATATMLPFAVWMLFAAPWPTKAGGIGIMLAYAFFMAASARVEIGTRDVIAAERNRALTEELRRQRDAVQKANEEKTRFLAATSHDLAQPLHAQGFYIAAIRQRTDDPAVLALVSKVENTWRGLGQLLDGLVEISRLDAGAIVPDRRTTDLLRIATRIRDEFAGPAAQKGVQLLLEMQPVHAHTDGMLFGRILRNLVSNAVKFTGPGGRVRIHGGPLDGRAVIGVEDTGCGIPETAQNRVFDEYVQLGNSARNREKGLGLGLSIVRRLTALLGVDLEIRSVVGHGTSMTLSLPEAEGGVEHAAGRGPGDGAVSVAHLRVLVVDDEEAIRMSMSEVLTSWGCEVFSTSGNGSVLSFLDAMDATPDLLIVDQQLGEDVQGTDVVASVREELNETVPAILMSGNVAALAHVEMDDLRVLQKPIRPETLLGILQETAAQIGHDEETPRLVDETQ